jgi:hypothetical protein
VLHIQDLDGNTYYTVNDNRWNGEFNECREKKWFANGFYTIDLAPNATQFIDGPLFLGLYFKRAPQWSLISAVLGMVSTIILNLAGDHDESDSCTQWTLIYRHVCASVR